MYRPTISNMNIIHILLPMFLLLSNCTLFNSNEKNFESTFKAEINGEKFDITETNEKLVQVIASISENEDISFLFIHGKMYNQNVYPFNEIIDIAVPWEESTKFHPLGSDTVFFKSGFYWIKRGMYSEWDGDARISNYITKPDNQGSFSVNIEELENGDRVVYGQFDFTVVMEDRGDELSQRIGQDTLHITNGEYRLLLDDRRED